MAEKKYIEYEAVLKQMQKIKYNFSPMVRPMFDVFKHIMHQTPAADVVKVVRCKDCEYIHGPQHGVGYCYPEGSASYRVVSLDDFCKYGKRRDKE